MQLKLKSFLLALLVLAIAHVQAENFRLSFETISADSIGKDLKYKKLKEFDLDQAMTIIRIHGLPSSENYILKWERPLLAEKNFEQEYGREVFIRLKDFLGEKDSLLVMSGRGFAPGEKVVWSLETNDGKLKTEKLSFTPNPIILEDLNQGIKLEAELAILIPTYYEVSLNGLEDCEEINFRSTSSGEVIDRDIFYKKNSMIAIMPGVIGKKGGFVDFTITRKQGGQLKLQLPWGDDLCEHLLGNHSPITKTFKSVSN